jgi:hypothetical protein
VRRSRDRRFLSARHSEPFIASPSLCGKEMIGQSGKCFMERRSIGVRTADCRPGPRKLASLGRHKVLHPLLPDTYLKARTTGPEADR